MLDNLRDYEEEFWTVILSALKEFKMYQESKSSMTKQLETRLLGITVPDIKLYYKTIITKIIRYWHKNRHINQWNKIESSYKSTHIYGQLIFDKSAENMQWGKESLK